MAETTNQPDFFGELAQELKEVWEGLGDGFAPLSAWLHNQLLSLRREPLDYLIMPLGGSLPERTTPPRSFIERQLPLPSAPLSLEALNGRLQAISDDPYVKGVLFIFQGFQTGMATLQNLRRAVERFRATGKEVIVYTPFLDLTHYYAASAANKIIIPSSTQFDVLGLRSELTFLKDTLQQVGVSVDVVQISPYKTAFDTVGKADLTPEYRAQIDWLLDEQFSLLTADMAEGRKLTQAEFQRWMNRAPLTAEEALAAGLVDHVAYEDELVYLLAKPTAVAPNLDHDESSDETPAAAKKSKPQAQLTPWSEGRGQLHRRWRRRTQKFIGVISLEGTIMMGPSRQPPIDLPIPFIGGSTAGEATLVQLLRQAEQLDNMAALIFHVDSGGGSALASDLIGRQIMRIVQKKPVLAYMGNVAASGGYYVSAPARHIMAQRSTITGSIGVITARISTQELYHKLAAQQVSLQRGDHAGLYSASGPMTPEERELFWQGIVHNYEKFKQVVANGRSLPIESLDPLCEGRVWVGTQAQRHGLIDSYGDFVDAIRCAAELAKLPLDDNHTIAVVNLHPKSDGYVPPKPFEAAEEISRWLFGSRLQALSGQALMLMPVQIKLK